MSDARSSCTGAFWQNALCLKSDFGEKHVFQDGDEFENVQRVRPFYHRISCRKNCKNLELCKIREWTVRHSWRKKLVAMCTVLRVTEWSTSANRQKSYMKSSFWICVQSIYLIRQRFAARKGLFDRTFLNLCHNVGIFSLKCSVLMLERHFYSRKFTLLFGVNAYGAIWSLYNPHAM